jgi:hypothetical protein
MLLWLEGVEGEGMARQEAALPMPCYIVPCFTNSQWSMPATVTHEGAAYCGVVLRFHGVTNLFKVVIRGFDNTLKEINYFLYVWSTQSMDCMEVLSKVQYCFMCLAHGEAVFFYSVIVTYNLWPYAHRNSIQFQNSRRNEVQYRTNRRRGWNSARMKWW